MAIHQTFRDTSVVLAGVDIYLVVGVFDVTIIVSIEYISRNTNKKLFDSLFPIRNI